MYMLCKFTIVIHMGLIFLLGMLSSKICNLFWSFLNKIFYLLSLWLLLISPRLLKALFKYVFFELCLKMILDCQNVINPKNLSISFSFVDFLMSFGIKIVFIWSFLWPDVPPIDHCALTVPFSFGHPILTDSWRPTKTCNLTYRAQFCLKVIYAFLNITFVGWIRRKEIVGRKLSYKPPPKSLFNIWFNQFETIFSHSPLSILVF